MKYIAGILCGLVATVSTVNAGMVDNVQITSIMMDKNYGDKVYLRTSPQRALEGCHESSWAFVLGLETNLDKHFYSILLSAYTSGKLIKLEGTGECDLHYKIETLRRVELK